MNRFFQDLSSALLLVMLALVGLLYAQSSELGNNTMAAGTGSASSGLTILTPTAGTSYTVYTLTLCTGTSGVVEVTVDTVAQGAGGGTAKIYLDLTAHVPYALKDSDFGTIGWKPGASLGISVTQSATVSFTVRYATH